MQVEKMSAPLGAVIRDLDVRSIDVAQWSELNALFCEHHVLVFPKQNLTPTDQEAFATRWGSLIPFPYGGLPDHPIIKLVNKGKQKDVNQHWHSDMSYNPKPPKLTMLYALDTPQFGGDTAFANQALAYDDMSPGMKALLVNLVAHHSAKGLARLYGQDETAAPEADHPVIRTHDESGKKCLYICKAFTESFNDWHKDESKALLNYLFEHAVRPEYQARHHWQVGDLVMWDNRAVLHYAVHDHGDESRIINRLQVEGDRPC